mgnify:CR=1 FL=1
MREQQFIVEIDGRRVTVNQREQQVEILDDAGNVLFSDSIQVAAGSLQGLFMALSDSTQPGKTA